MTTESKEPVPGEQQLPTDQNATPGAQTQPEPQTEPEVTDVDDKALADAAAAAQAEDAAGGGTAGTTVEPGQSQQQPTQPAAQDPAQPGGQQQPSTEPVLIPKARFDEVGGQRDKALEQAAYWRGVAEARGGTQQPAKPGDAQPQPQQQQTPTPEARLTEIHAKQDALAVRLDNGEITMAEFTRDNRALQTQENTINAEVLTSKLTPAQQNADGNELYLDAVTAQIETQHPWVQVYEAVATKSDWQYIRDTAFNNLVEKGVDPTTPRGTLALREEAATLMDKYGPVFLTDKATAKGIKLPTGQTQPAPQQQQQQPAGQQTQKPRLDTIISGARDAKLTLAATQPPNLSNMGGTPASVGELNESGIEGMTETALEDLSEAQVQRLLGITG